MTLRSSTNSPFVDNRTPTPDQTDAAYLNQVGDEVNLKYVKPAGGITAADLAAAVTASLNKADTALQSLGAGSVGITQLADGSVDTAAIIDGNVTLAKLSAGVQASLAGGGGGGGLAHTDNGDGTGTFTGTGFTDNGDGTGTLS